MTSNPNVVKIIRPYHHGALREALLDAAESVLMDRGVDGFSLRETARRAKVSPSAPSHHFGDTRGLLTALAAAAFGELADALEMVGEGAERTQRVRQQGRAYVAFALRRRGRFDLMWREALLDRDQPELQAAARRAFLALDQAVRGDAATEETHPADLWAVPSIAAWALVHGFARLAIDGTFGTGPGDAERAAEVMLPAVLEHLVV